MRAFSCVALFYSLNALAADPCQFTTENWGAVHAKAHIAFPDGRQFDVIGHNHGASETTAQLIAAVSDKSSPNDVYIKNIQTLLASSRTAIEHANVDIRYLRQKFKTSDSTFLAVEASPSANMRGGLTTWLKETMLKEFARRKIENPSLRDRALLAFGSADGYLAATEPGLIKAHPIIGVDSGEMETLPEIWASEDKLFSQLMDVTKSDAIWTEKFKESQGQLKSFYLVGDQLTDAQLKDKILKDVPQKYLPQATAWLSAQLREVQTMNIRDKAIVKNTLLENKSAVILIGYAHLQSLIAKLQRACQGAIAPTANISDPAANRGSSKSAR